MYSLNGYCKCECNNAKSNEENNSYLYLCVGQQKYVISAALIWGLRKADLLVQLKGGTLFGCEDTTFAAMVNYLPIVLQCRSKTYFIDTGTTHILDPISICSI